MFKEEQLIDVCMCTVCSIAAGIDESCGDRESVAGHLLLFISALIPKAVASLLTSAVIELSKPENVCCRLYYRHAESTIQWGKNLILLI